MGRRTPPRPQRPPNARETEIVDAIRAYLDEPTDGIDGQLDRIKGLRGIVVDADAIWEEALVRAKGAGATWAQLMQATGAVLATMQRHVKQQTAAAFAEQPRESTAKPRPSGAAQRRSAKARAESASNDIEALAG